MTTSFCSRDPVIPGVKTLVAAATTVMALMMAAVAPPAVADTVNNGCMQDVAGFALNCTANDVSVAGVSKDAQGNPILTLDDADKGCSYPGDTVDFTAQFDLVVTAKERYDIGVYFALDGGGTDGALTGSCAVTSLDSLNSVPFIQKDAAPDACGDIESKANPLKLLISLKNVQCVDRNGDGQLDFPNCVSWRQTGANELCLDALDAFPGAPSKCKCDTGFNIPITVPSATIAVTKTPRQASVNEPGANVTYDVMVKNTGIDPGNPFTLQSLVDSKFGNLNGKGTCSVPQTIQAQATYSCYFTAFVGTNVKDSPHVNKVTASGVDSRSNPASGSDDASVDILGVDPVIEVTKSASPTEVKEPGGSVEYTVTVKNNSVSSDPLALDSLSDNKFGSLSGLGSCNTGGNLYPTALASGATYTCKFTKTISGNAGYVHTNTVTGSAHDDEGKTASDSDSATVNVTNVPSTIEVTKTASPTSLPEPGGEFTFTIVVKNLSAVDTVTISSLSDDKFGSLSGKGTCAVPQTIGTLGSYTCSFKTSIAGNADDSHTNTVTASGKDDDNDPVSDSEDETVNFTDVLPKASLTKKATKALVTYEVKVVNQSAAEEAYLTSLTDDKFGDLTDQNNSKIESTTCAATTLEPAGKTGDTYTCTFEALVTESPHTNVATAEVTDDDGNSVAPAPSDDETVSFFDPPAAP
jgi:hypothetical protein